MAAKSSLERFSVWPVRSNLSNFEQEERAYQALGTALGEPVVRAPAPRFADGILLCSGGVEEDCVRLLDGGSSHVFLAGPDFNAFAAGAEVAAYARRHGIHLRLQPVFPEAGDEIQAWMHAERVRNALREARLGLLGGSAGWLVSSLPSQSRILERFGVDLQTIEWPELMEAVGVDFPFRKAPAAGRWTSVARSAEIGHPDMRRSLGFSASLSQAVRRWGFDAIALECFGHLMQLGTTGCVALADLCEDGIPAACEGDTGSALTMLALHRVTGQTPWLANLAFMQGSTVWLSHCSAAPGLAESVELVRHFESGGGVAARAKLPEGQAVTIVRLAGDLSEAVVLQGRIRGSESAPNRCRTQAVIDLERELPAILGNHHILVFGHHRASLEAFFALSGMELL